MLSQACTQRERCLDNDVPLSFILWLCSHHAHSTQLFVYKIFGVFGVTGFEPRCHGTMEGQTRSLRLGISAYAHIERKIPDTGAFSQREIGSAKPPEFHALSPWMMCTKPKRLTRPISSHKIMCMVNGCAGEKHRRARALSLFSETHR